MKIKTYILYTEGGRQAVPYILDANDLDISEEELWLSIYEQVYGEQLK